jgi:hypothetical protein
LQSLSLRAGNLRIIFGRAIQLMRRQPFAGDSRAAELISCR